MGASSGSPCRCGEDRDVIRDPIVTGNLPEVAVDRSDETCSKASGAALTSHGLSAGVHAQDGGCSTASTIDTARETELEVQRIEQPEPPKKHDEELQMPAEGKEKPKRKQSQPKKKTADRKQDDNQDRQELPDKGAETDAEEAGKVKPSAKKKLVKAKSKAKAVAKSPSTKSEPSEETKDRKWIDEEVAKEKKRRAKAKKSGVKTGDGLVAWKDGKLVLAQDSSSSDDEEWVLSKMNATERAIYLERKRLGIKKAPKADCVTM